MRGLALCSLLLLALVLHHLAIAVPILATAPHLANVEGSRSVAFLSRSEVVKPVRISLLKRVGEGEVDVGGGVVDAKAFNLGGERALRGVIEIAFPKPVKMVELRFKVVAYGELATARYRVVIAEGNESELVLDEKTSPLKPRGSPFVGLAQGSERVSLRRPCSSVTLVLFLEAPSDPSSFVRLVLSGFQGVAVQERIYPAKHVMSLVGEAVRHVIVFENVSKGIYLLHVLGLYKLVSIDGARILGAVGVENGFRVFKIDALGGELRIVAESPNAVLAINAPPTLAVGKNRVSVTCLASRAVLKILGPSLNETMEVPCNRSVWLDLPKPGRYELVAMVSTNASLGYMERVVQAISLSIAVEVRDLGSVNTIVVEARYSDGSPLKGFVKCLGRVASFENGVAALNVSDSEVAALSALELEIVETRVGLPPLVVAVPVKHLEFVASRTAGGILIKFFFEDGTVPNELAVEIGGVWRLVKGGSILIPLGNVSAVPRIEDARVVGETKFVVDETRVRNATIVLSEAPLYLTSGSMSPLFVPGKPKNVVLYAITTRPCTIELLMEVEGKTLVVGRFRFNKGSVSIPVTIPPLNRSGVHIIKFFARDVLTNRTFLVGSLIVVPARVGAYAYFDPRDEKLHIELYAYWKDPVTGEVSKVPISGEVEIVTSYGRERVYVRNGEATVKLRYSTTVEILYRGKMLFDRYISITPKPPISPRDYVLLGVGLFLLAFVSALRTRTIEEETRFVARTTSLESARVVRPRFSWVRIVDSFIHYARNYLNGETVPLTLEEAYALAVEEGYVPPPDVEKRIAESVPPTLPPEEREERVFELLAEEFLKELSRVSSRSPEIKVSWIRVRDRTFLLPEKELRRVGASMLHQVLVRLALEDCASTGWDAVPVETKVLRIRGSEVPAPDVLAASFGTRIAIEVETKHERKGMEKVGQLLDRVFAVLSRGVADHVVVVTLDEEFEDLMKVLEDYLFKNLGLPPSASPELVLEALREAEVEGLEAFAELLAPRSGEPSFKLVQVEGRTRLVTYRDPRFPVEGSFNYVPPLIVCPISRLEQLLLEINERVLEREARKRL